MKLFIASAIQETNTFSPLATDINLFRRGYYLQGNEIPESLAGTNTEINGFLEYFEGADDVNILWGIACWGVAAGKITTIAYTQILRDILYGLQSQMPVDGVLLALHGAMVAEKEPDCSGDILERIRTIVGASVPVVTTLDYHANITRKMVSAADVMIGFRTYPHVDFKKTGLRAAAVMRKILYKKTKIRPLWIKLSLVVPVENAETSSGISGEVISRIAGFDEDSGLVAASLFCTQPWLDVPEAGVSLLFYAEANSEAVFQPEINRLAEYILQNKESYFRSYPNAQEALNEISGIARPCIFVDSGDITTAGGMGDSTFLLRQILKRGLPLHVALTIVDAAAVQSACSAGEGGAADFVIGHGKAEYNRNVNLHARVMRIVDMPSKIHGESFSGIQVNAGRRVYLKAGNYLHVIVTEFSAPFHDPQILKDMGIDPSKMDIIVQKSHKLFRQAYKDIAKTIMILDTPGYTSMNLLRLPFKNLPRPLYPFDKE
jgi:microcystin degradation protein MlrC